jgi:hypothetical protein
VVVARYPLALGVTFFASGLLFISPLVWAQEEMFVPPAAAVQTLAPVIVIGNSESPPVQESTLDQEVIRQLPAGNGSLSELLRLLPGLQLSENFNSAATGGEILPPTTSISGGKVYQNNFLVDGIANNNLIDPAKGAVDNVTDAPGHPLERFLNSNVIESVTLYDSNVPARFGNFTGGVVEATTRNPGKEVEGHFSYRTTRNQWTKFHIAEADQGDFAAGGRAELPNLQPKFSKNDYDATLSLPLTEKMGLLTSWHQLDSRIPLPYFLGSKTQQRRQESYFLKYVGEFSADDRLEVSLNSTPYREDLFIKNVQGSDFAVKMEGLALAGEWRHAFARGEVELGTAYRRSSNLRSGPQHFRSWAATDSKDWGRLVGAEFSVEGGFGTVEKIQESFDLKSLVRLDPFLTGVIRHELTSGIDLNQTRGSFERKNTTHVYDGAYPSVNILCGANDFDCVEHEQFFTRRIVYDAGMSRAVINQLGLHGEDLLRYRRLELRPGLRFDYNDLMEQANLAPRFVASYDLFGNGATVLSAGTNRYYGTTLLTTKLREGKIPFRSESRTPFHNQPTLWTAASAQGPSATRFTTLRTPYADELSVGLDQKIAGGVFNFKYLRREGHDEFARTFSPLQPDGLRYYTLNNLGRSHHERYSLAWERHWPRHLLALNASWQETTTSNEGYDTELESEEINGRIWYNDELIFKSELPARVQNRPIIVNLIWVAELPARFTFTNLSRYRSGYREIVQTGEFRPLPVSRIDPVTGEEILDAVAVYEDITHAGKVIFDWKLGWSTPVYHQQLLVFSLEVNNVLNSRTQTGGIRTTYEMGRQFWAGVAYDF